ncbi:MAG: DUF4249 family protein [Saprospiraceae bacterium]
MAHLHGVPHFVRLLFFPLLLGLSSCVDNIEVPAPDVPDSGMLVQGKFLYGRPSFVTAEVYELYTLSSNLPKPIGGAKVVLEDDRDHRVELLSNALGSYFLELNPDDPDFPIAEGSPYRLTVSLPNGKKYQSAWEILQPAPKPEGIETTFVQREFYDNLGVLRMDTFVQFGINTPLTAPNTTKPARFRWEFSQGYKLTDDPGKTCFVVRSLLADNVYVFNGATAGQNNLDNYHLVETRLDSRMSEGFYLLVYQQSITENAFGYFDELHQLLSKKGTLFDPPAGAIRSNIISLNDPNELTYGFFYAAKQDTSFYYLSPQAAGYPDFYCPLPPTNGEAPRPNACDDCLLDLGAQLEKPIWWKF